jgi:hypothetical protein
LGHHRVSFHEQHDIVPLDSSVHAFIDGLLGQPGVRVEGHHRNPGFRAGKGLPYRDSLYDSGLNLPADQQEAIREEAG